ncbi:MAG: type II secretion system F family protein [Deltaproteobacteria bacterium]|nr:type II secretion system F family protein [Deltaproteobacteria bacterium]
MDTVVEALLPLIFFAAGIAVLLRSGRRTAKDVLYDLTDDGEAEGQQPGGPIRVAGRTKAQAKNQLHSGIPLFAACFVSGTAAALWQATPVMLIAAGSSAFILSRAIFNGLRRRALLRYRRSIEFYLPIVMERLVMAAEAGMDILPAIAAVSRKDASQAVDNSALPRAVRSEDPVSELLLQALEMTERGMTFSESLNFVSAKTDCSALRHAFAHLAVAQKEGGELVAPLRELSDSTQIYYQESIEEEIAKLPVKATLPLLCTFTGLIVCFITSPIIQILGLTSEAGVGG